MPISHAQLTDALDRSSEPGVVWESFSVGDEPARGVRFQGEDVSLGIWLAGHRARRVSDPAWACGAADGGGYSRGQLSPARLRRVWRCLRRAGRLELCGDEREEDS